ncbi:hypothetical protein GQ457_02G006240 [Hibiscus cannabinus]
MVAHALLSYPTLRSPRTDHPTAQIVSPPTPLISYLSLSTLAAASAPVLVVHFPIKTTSFPSLSSFLVVLAWLSEIHKKKPYTHGVVMEEEEETLPSSPPPPPLPSSSTFRA